MKKIPTMVYLEKHQREMIDRKNKDTGVAISEIVRRCIDWGFDDQGGIYRKVAGPEVAKKTAEGF